MVMAPSIELKIESIYNPWAFIDLIDYRGGTASFERCHYDYMLVLSAPQLWEGGRLTQDLAKQWALACGLPEDTLLQKGGGVIKPPVNRMLQMARGHWKSTLVIAYLLWRIYRNENIRILHATNIKDLSQAFIRELRMYFEDQQLQETVWNLRPHRRGPLVPELDKTTRRYYGEGDNESKDRKVIWSNQQIQMVRSETMKEPTVFSTSVKSKATGQHYDVIIFDDIVDYDNSRTAAKIATVGRWAADIASIRNIVSYESHYGTLPDGTKLKETLGDEYVVTGTPYDPNDFYATTEKKAADLDFCVFKRNIYANGVDNLDGYTWSRFTERHEKRLRSELSEVPGVFDAQYLLCTNSSELQVINTETIEWISKEKFMNGRTPTGLVEFYDGGGGFHQVSPIMAVDFAISLNARADFTAIAVGGKSAGGKLVCLEMSAGHFSVDKTLAEIIRIAKFWRVKRIFVETISFQALYRRQILEFFRREGFSAAVIDYNPVGNKHKRIEAQLGTYFTNGDICITSQMKHDIPVLNTFKFFGRPSAKDDPPDALSVVAEKSFPPERKRTQDPRGRRSTSLSINSRYGGLY